MILSLTNEPAPLIGLLALAGLLWLVWSAIRRDILDDGPPPPRRNQTAQRKNPKRRPPDEPA